MLAYGQKSQTHRKGLVLRSCNFLAQLWYRKLIASKFDGSKFRKSRGGPRVDEETERLVVRMAKENPGWGYDRIVGAMANLGLRLSDQTVGNN